MPIPVPGGFAGTKETNFDPLPSGTYQALVVAVEHRPVKDETAERWRTDPEKGDPEEAAMMGGEHPGVLSWEFDITAPENYDNRKTWHQTPLTRKGRGILLQPLLAVGYTREELDSEDFAIDIDRLVGKRVGLIIAVDRRAENIPGQPKRTRVRNVVPPDTAESASDEVMPQ